MSSFSTSDIQKHIRALEGQGLSGQALEQRIYQDAQKYGVTATQLEQAQGWNPGTVNNWTAQNNLNPLINSPAQKTPRESSTPAVPRMAANDNRGISADRMGSSVSGNNFTTAEIQQHIRALEDQGLSGLALEHRIYQDAQKHGVTATQLEQAQGWKPGTVNNWTAQNNLKPLINSPAQNMVHLLQPQQMPQFSMPRTRVSRNQTSQGQLKQMLDSNSPLMRQASTQGLQRMAQRGLLNSSMASQAAQGAMIAAAEPFARRDASTFFQNEQANARRKQQAFMQQMQFKQQMQLNDQQFNNELRRMGYGFELNQQRVPQTYASNIAGQTLQNIQMIQADPNLYPEAKRGAIQNAVDIANQTLSWTSKFYNTPLPSMRTPG